MMVRFLAERMKLVAGNFLQEALQAPIKKILEFKKPTEVGCFIMLAFSLSLSLALSRYWREYLTALLAVSLVS